MRKQGLVIFLLILTLLVGCSTQNSDSDNKNTTPLQNIPHSFGYINKNGNIVINNLTEGKKQVVAKGNFIVSWSVNTHEQLVSYIVNHTDNEYGNTEVILKNYKSNEQKILASGKPYTHVQWSPNGRFLLLFSCTYELWLWGEAEIYDVQNDTLSLLEMPVIVWSHYNSWSPDGKKVFLGVQETVFPEAPIWTGKSVTTVVLHVEDDFSVETVKKGTIDFYTEPYAWLDNHTVTVKSDYFTNYTKEQSPEGRKYKRELTKINLITGQEKDISLVEIEGIQPPEDVASHHYQISPDKKYVLYIDSEDTMMLWIVDTDERIQLDEGYSFKWL